MTSPRERAQLASQLRQQQEALVRDLLPVLDALDRAEAHWQRVVASTEAAAEGAAKAVDQTPGSDPGLGERLWSRLLGWLQRRRPSARPQPAATSSPEALARSAGEGIRLIRHDLLEALQGHGLEPIESLGSRFDPERMRALAQQPAPPGTEPGVVVVEAVRGYLWHHNLLREAQVLVAGP
ncbi:MAG: nucleotide exchange factor GrpE [Synechococcus sp.]